MLAGSNGIQNCPRWRASASDSPLGQQRSREAVSMREHRQPVIGDLHRQTFAVQCLDLGFVVHAQHQRSFRRVLAPPPSAAPPPPPARRRSAPAPRRQPDPLSARIARRAVRSVSLNDQPERTKLSQPVLAPTDRDRGSKHGETAALDERQLEPARDHRAGEVPMADEHHVA